MADAQTQKKSILKSPRITEKAALAQSKGNVYTFNVEDTATKRSVADEIKAAYKVTPVSVRIARTPAKRVWVRGKWGTKRGGKKAYVALKKGDSIAA